MLFCEGTMPVNARSIVAPPPHLFFLFIPQRSPTMIGRPQRGSVVLAIGRRYTEISPNNSRRYTEISFFKNKQNFRSNLIYMYLSQLKIYFKKIYDFKINFVKAKRTVRSINRIFGCYICCFFYFNFKNQTTKPNPHPKTTTLKK